MSSLYPLYLKLDDRRVVVIGGGRVALRRIRGLLAAGARVRVVSPEVVPGIEAAFREGSLEWEARRYVPGDLEGAALALVATGDPAVVENARAEADGLGIFLNTAEDEAQGDFHVPAVAGRGGVRIAVSTGGASPALAAALRRRIEEWLSSLGENAVEELRQERSRAREADDDDKRDKRDERNERDERTATIRRLAQGLVPQGGPVRSAVALVGAGPGDPGLLTVRARDLLRDADVVFHDRLVSREILDTIPRTVEKVYVGKEVGRARRANIAALMIEAARAGKRVVRLKGGDPVLFGRGGEEMLALRQAGIEHVVVPGVSALCSVPGAAGIPVTYRGIASELVVRSGHRWRHAEPAQDGRADLERRGTADETTYVYFMAAAQIDRVVTELSAEGLPRTTPVAIIEKGTLPHEKVVIGDLGDIVEKARRADIEPPALVVAGNVVTFRRIDDFLALLSRTEAAPAPETEAGADRAAGRPRERVSINAEEN